MEAQAAPASLHPETVGVFRLAGIVISALLVLAFALPTAFLGWRERGEVGATVSRTGEITHVVANSPATAAGLRVGDQVVRSSLTARERLVLTDQREFIPVGFVFHGDVLRDGQRVPITLATRPVPSHVKPGGRALMVGEFIVFAVYIIIGATLFALRPGWMTFAFYVFCIATMPDLDVLRAYNWMPSPWYGRLYVGVETLVDGLTPVPLLPFVLRFPHDRLGGWRSKVSPFVLALVFVAFVYWFSYEWRLVYDPNFNPSLLLEYDLPVFGVFALAGVILLFGYVTASEEDRQRIKYAVLGMSFAFGSLTLSYVDASAGDVSYAIVRALYMLSVLMPVAVAYAILWQRLVDVNFALNRALVFGIMSSALVVAIGFLDWALGNTISSVHLATAIEATASVALGLMLDRVYDFVKDFVERTIFRARHQAEQYLERVARSLPFAMDAGVIDNALTHEAASALSLASVALFRRDEPSACYMRLHSIGWGDGTLDRLDLDDDLVRFLESDSRPLDIAEVRWHRERIPAGNLAPVMAVPIVVRHMLIAFALYGGHRNGTDLDPAEVALIDRLSTFAANAYDHVDTLVLERTVTSLRERNAALETLAEGHVSGEAIPDVRLPSVNSAAAAHAGDAV